jgi:hypothetical protein
MRDKLKRTPPSRFCSWSSKRERKRERWRERKRDERGFMVSMILD